MKTLTKYEEIKAMLENESSNESSAPKEKVATLPTQNYYTKVCKQKNVQPIPNFEQLTQNVLSDEIKKVQKLANFAPITSGQITGLEKRFAKCFMPLPENLLELSMNQASEMIKKLDIIYEQKYAHIVTEGQLDFIGKMVICPDIGVYELCNAPQELVQAKSDNVDEIVVRKQMLEKIFSLKQKAITSQDGSLADLELAEKQTTDEIAKFEDEQVILKAQLEEITSSFDIENVAKFYTKEEVSLFIQKHQATYYKWSKTRASDGQRDLINVLRKRVGDPELDHATLMQFNKDTANKYITQLQSEGGQMAKAPVEETYEDTDRALMFPKTLAEAEEAYHKSLRDTVYKLCAVIGQNADNNPIFESANFNAEFRDLIRTTYVYTEKQHLIDLLAPVVSEEDVEEILK